MKHRLAFLLFLLPFLGIAQERGAGIRLGEPFNLTYKDFFDDYFSWEVMIGSGGINSPGYYQRDFENNPPSSNAFYIGHSASKGVSLHGRVAYHEDFTDVFDISQGYLLGYGGVGAQLRTTQVNYTYNLGAGESGGTFSEQRSNVDFGPEAFVGGEYYFDELPISVFAEVGIFLELLDRVGHIKGQGGIGVRYLF
ncbi:hypothetical protein E4S40_12040 [Algoriphagus kandeliae]|uniref:Outer membrane protein beta-barrel domain-containing protein n=1 Tax=Algoriphagus kandeliae TaxID=2562278 RepID=A0A4Y9QU26_9BACT|nr:hypothetical protein [Algoriphagus kandeliae]TFV94733.1 hypothetical protein E4S40_12040 [Algoriphagus kandeliae]